MKKGVLKIIAVALIAVAAVGAFASCKGNGENNDNIFAVKVGDVTVELGKNADGVLEKLGTPVHQQNTGNCGGLGETVRYEYPSFVMVIVDYEDGDKIIDQIELKNDGVETSKGIYIGASESAVKEAYGEPDENKGRALVYTEGNRILEIGMIDGAVISIVLKCK